MLTTGNQLRAARSLIGMDQNALADLARLNVNTIRSMEAAGLGPIAGRAANVQSVQRELEAAGVEFMNHGQPGVRLKSTQPALALGRWWELHLLLDQGWQDGDRQDDFGRIIKGPLRPPNAVVTVREYASGGMDVRWTNTDCAAVAAALKKHPNLPSGMLAPAMAI